MPHAYESRLHWTPSTDPTLSAPPRPDIAGDAAPAFGGSDAAWDPEHLLLASLNLCLMLSFRAIAAKARIDVASYESRTFASVEKTAAGFAITSIGTHVALRVANAADVERAGALLRTAKRYCIVSNALKIEPELEADVAAA